MRSTLFLIPLRIGDVPLFGWGALLAVWAVFAVAMLAWLVRRHGWGRETASYLPALALLGGVIWVVPRIFSEGIPIRGYGVMVLLGATAGIAIAAYRARRMGLDSERIVSVCFWMIVFGILGARAFYVIQYWEDFRAPTVAQTLANVVNYTRGGLVVYGSLLGGAATFFIYTARHSLPALAIADLLAPGVALGIAIGRLGCFLNGCCFGGLCEAPWAVTFPADSPPYLHQVSSGQLHGMTLVADRAGRPEVSHVREGSLAAGAGVRTGEVVASINTQATDSLAGAQQALMTASGGDAPIRVEMVGGQLRTLAAAPRSLPTHPAQIYSSITALLVAWFLWAYYPFRRRDGELLALLMVLYSVARFLLEMIRTDEAGILATQLTISQTISLLVLPAGIAFWCFLRSRATALALPPPAQAR